MNSQTIIENELFKRVEKLTMLAKQKITHMFPYLNESVFDGSPCVAVCRGVIFLKFSLDEVDNFSNFP